MPDSEPPPPKERERDKIEKDVSKAVEDVKEFFMAEGEDDSPTSDSGAQPPG
jgi:hypothetical protein